MNTKDGKKILDFSGGIGVLNHGHNNEEILSALNSEVKLPKVIIAHTTKGKGVSFMENQVLWHYRSPQGDEFESAIDEVQSNEK